MELQEQEQNQMSIILYQDVERRTFLFEWKFEIMSTKDTTIRPGMTGIDCTSVCVCDATQ